MIVRNHTITTKKSGSAWILLEPNKNTSANLMRPRASSGRFSKPTTPDAIVKKCVRNMMLPEAKLSKISPVFSKNIKSSASLRRFTDDGQSKEE